MNLISGIITFFITATLAAETNCAPREQVAEILTNHGETRQSIALSAYGAIIEIWVNPNTGTWTIVINRPDGMACLADFGTAFGPVVAVKGEAS